MTSFGYTLLAEQASPADLVANGVRAEEAGFDFLAASDHFNPWIEEQGHAPYTWSVLGALARATSEVDLMTMVTCPILRYHPAVVAQKAATVAALSEGRFTLGLGAGENLNEHVVGRGWPAPDVRHEMLEDALEIITRLFSGERVTHRGGHIDAQGARLWDLPDPPPPVGVAVSGPSSCELAGRFGDLMIAVEPNEELGERFDRAGGAGKPRVGQAGLCYDRDEDAARARAVEQFRWFGGGWPVLTELPEPANFAAATEAVTEDDVAAQVACGPDVDAHVASVKRFVDAGFTHVSVVQVGPGRQDEFLEWAGKELLPALRDI